MSAERYDVWTIDDLAPVLGHRARRRAQSLTLAAAERRAERGNDRIGRNGYGQRYVIVPAGTLPDEATETPPPAPPVIGFVGYR